MLENRGPLTLYSFDTAKFNKTLDREMSIVLREGVRLWLRTVLDVISGAPHTVGDNFPIQTGRAKGALQPLGRAVRVAVPISPAPGKKNRSSEGALSSNFEIRDDQSHPLSFMYRFNWSTDLEHWATNELNYIEFVRSATPWRAIEEADNALDAYINAEIPKRLSKFILTKWIKPKKGTK